MDGNNLMCMICCLSYKPPRPAKKLVNESGVDSNILEVVSKFSDDILSEWKQLSSVPSSSEQEQQEVTTSSQPTTDKNEEGVKKQIKRRKKGRKKIILEHIVEKLEAGEDITNHGGRYTVEKISVEGRSNIQEILESCEPDNMSICPDCVENMKNITEARAESIQMERKVRKLQLVLLKGLRCLQSQMKRFYDEMKKLDRNLSTADVSCLEATLSLAGTKKSKKVRTLFGRTPVNRYTIRRERVLRLRRQISEASRDLRRYQSEIREKILLKEANGQDGGTNSFPQGPQSSLISDVKMEVGEEFTGEDDTGFDFEMGIDDEDVSKYEEEWSDSKPLLPGTSASSAGIGDDYILAESVNAATKTDHNEENKVYLLGEDDEDELGEKSPESDVDDDNDDDYNPLKVTKRSSRTDRDRYPFTRDLDYLLKNIPDFKRSVIEGVLKNRQNIRAKLKKGSKIERTPFHRHIMELEYHPDQKAVILSGIIIHVLDKQENPDVENGLECSKCSHRVSADVEKMELAMYDHIISKHFEAYSCPICEINLDTDQEYRTHIKECRKNNESCMCDICGKTLSCRRTMEKHKWYHMNDEEKAEAIANGFKPVNQKKVTERNFACEICPKKFKFRTELKSHQETHKSREERGQFICPHCGKTFLKSGYDYHQKYSDCAITSGEGVPPPPVECPVCKKTLKSKMYLQRHMKLQHSNAAPSELYRFVCQQCGKGFKVKDGLRKHELTHTGLKPFECKRCSSTFNCASNLKRHEKKCQPVQDTEARSAPAVEKPINQQNNIVQNQVPFPENLEASFYSYYPNV